jgi:osmoprotectant transport system substrate-binding protein
MYAFRTRRLTTALAVLAITAAACGGSDVGDDAGDPAAGGSDGAETDGAETDGAETDGAETDGTDTDGEAAAPGDGPTITVASFNFPESTILAEIYAQTMEDAGYPVERQLNLGARELIFPELTSGTLSFLPEYLGSALVVGFDQDPPEDVDSGVEQLQGAFEGDDIEVLEPAPAVNANAFVTTTEFAEAGDLTTIADLEGAGDVTFVGPPECQDRETCFAGLADTYGLDNVTFSSVQEASARLGALSSGEAQLGLFFTTDAFLSGGDFTVLEDPEEIVPPENITPLLATEAVEAYGDDLTGLIDEVSGQLTTETLVDLNTSASEGIAPDRIATEWLQEAGILG